MAATSDPRQLSPKVLSGAKWGGALFVLVAVGAFILEGVTPELLHFLGPWAPLISGAIVLAGTLVRAYWVADPLRKNYWQQKQADEALQRQQAVAVNSALAQSDAVEASDTDDYQGKHVANPIVYNDGAERRET